MMNHRNEEYISRVNAAIDYIEAHIARTQSLTLETIARAAGFSPFHFHRIFKSVVGETLNSFVKRIRIERAALFMFNNPKLPITEIALKVGFTSSQVFARSFREHFKMTPSEYRKNLINSKNRNIKSKSSESFKVSYDYTSDSGRPTISYQLLSDGITMNVEIKELPDMHVAYIRHIGPYKGDSELFGRLYGKLGQWAGARELMGPDAAFISIYYDGPDVTDESKLRVDVGLVVPEGTKTDGEMNMLQLKGGKYAVARFEIDDPKKYEEAWNSIYMNWLPNSGFHAADSVPFEMYVAKLQGKDKQVVDICIPVEPV